MMRAIFTRRQRFLQAILCLILTICWASSGFAQAVNSNQAIPSAMSGSVLTQSLGGWTITVDSRWLDGQGYRPIRITVTPGANVPADRDLLVRICTDHAYNINLKDPMILTEKYLSIPSGTNAGQSINATISVPPSPLSSDFAIEIIDPSSTAGTVFQQTQLKGLGGRMGISDIDTVLTKYPHILFVGTTLPDTAMITNVMPPLQVYQTYLGNGAPGINLSPGARLMPDGTILMPDGSIVPNNPQPAPPTAMPGAPGTASPAADAPQAEGTAEDPATPKLLNIPLASAMALAAVELPENWIDYSSLDIVFLSLDQLADLAKNHPAAYRAILQWTASGGNLWIYGISGADVPWNRLDEVDKLLKREAKSANPKASGWREPGDEGTEFLQPGEEEALPVSPRAPLGYSPVVNEMEPPVNPPPTKPAPTSKQPMLLREFGMGTVALLSAVDPFAGEMKWMPENWNKLFHATGSARWKWNVRHGLNIGQQNPSFWNFLIPGVGLAPVRAFQVFITLFVLGIGPLNYWLLRRRQRLHLMVLTVPLSAVVVTAMLFGYALVADGLGIRVRARSVTRLDARRGEAVTWTRLSYYAGISPSKGLVFSPNTAVYPILDKSELDPLSPVRKKMTWDNNQLLEQGWINARTPTQYLTVRSGPSSCRLIITKPADAKQSVTVENRLGTPLDQMAVCDRDGNYYFVENVGDGVKAQAKEILAPYVQRWLHELAKELPLELPLGLTPRDWDRTMFVRNRNRYYYYNFRNTDSVSMDSSRLEGTLRRIATNSDLMAFGSDVPLLEPGTFLAKVPHVPEVELGTESAREEAGFHVIVGEW